jgi:hypothetical protein
LPNVSGFLQSDGSFNAIGPSAAAYIVAITCDINVAYCHNGNPIPSPSRGFNPRSSSCKAQGGAQSTVVVWGLIESMLQAWLGRWQPGADYLGLPGIERKWF